MKNDFQIMGILNFTPDSFSDGNKFFKVEDALTHAEKLLSDGADIIDLGVESTRPAAQKLSVEEELMRLKQILPALRKEFPQAKISIDTYKAKTAEYVIAEGIDIVNDISGMSEDMLEVISQNKNVKYVLTHNTSAIIEGDFWNQVLDFFEKKISKLCKVGVSKNNLILDLGFGFHKTVEQNLILQNRGTELRKLGITILAGVSRKSTLQKIVGTDIDDLDNATIAFSLHSLFAGSADIFRVHNVKKLRQAFDSIESIKKEKIWTK